MGRLCPIFEDGGPLRDLVSQVSWQTENDNSAEWSCKPPPYSYEFDYNHEKAVPIEPVDAVDLANTLTSPVHVAALGYGEDCNSKQPPNMDVLTALAPPILQGWARLRKRAPLGGPVPESSVQPSEADALAQRG